MSKNIQEQVYDEVVRVLNLNTQGLLFDGGWNVVFYNNIPYVIDNTSSNYYEHTRTEVIAVSEEFSTETPSINESDSAGFTASYQVFARLENLEALKTSLIEFRDYFFENKKTTIDGYQVTFKVSRGEKLPTVTPDGGNFYVRYIIKVYYDVTYWGYLVDSTSNGWEIKLATDTEYTTLKLAQDNFAHQGDPQMSNNQAVAKGDVGSKASNSALNVVYENNDRSDNAASNLMSRHLYSVVMNKVDKDTLYDMRHIFDGQVFTYKAKFISGARTNLPNGRVIMTLNWIEADE